MAVHASTTRRALFAAAALLPALPAFAVPPPKVSDAEFVKTISYLAPKGSDAALVALRAGFRPDQLVNILLDVGGAKDDLPALMFRTGPATYVTVRPSGVVR